MGLGISKSPEGVQALRTCANQLRASMEATGTAADSLRSAFDGVKADVAHEQEIEDIIEDIRVINSGVVTSIETLIQRLLQIASKLEAFISGGLGGN